MRRLGAILLWSAISAAFIGPGTVTVCALAGARHGVALVLGVGGVLRAGARVLDRGAPSPPLVLFLSVAVGLSVLGPAVIWIRRRRRP